MKYFTWMQLLGRSVAIYDYKPHLIASHGSDSTIEEFNYYAYDQLGAVQFAREVPEWAVDPDPNAPYIVSWYEMDHADAQVFIDLSEATEFWKVMIADTDFPTAIYDSLGERIGYFDQYGNLGEDDHRNLDEHANTKLKPYMQFEHAERSVAAKSMVSDLAKLPSSFIVAWLQDNKAEVTYANDAGEALGIYNSKIS